MIKLLILDIDGTMTDGKIYMSSDGEMLKSFSIKDGYGITHILPQLSIKPIVITGRKSKIVENRCSELKITDIYQGCSNKMEVLIKVMADYSVSFNELAYIGDDDNDLDCMTKIKKAGGFVGCPFDASPNVVRIADYISDKCGGDGAVRDFIERLQKVI